MKKLMYQFNCMGSPLVIDASHIVSFKKYQPDKHSSEYCALIWIDVSNTNPRKKDHKSDWKLLEYDLVTSDGIFNFNKDFAFIESLFIYERVPSLISIRQNKIYYLERYLTKKEKEKILRIEEDGHIIYNVGELNYGRK